uniref:Uncharacterized protein n=1 Tax=Anguilla anguilla TaxID=7936 RepID=A0A0E9WEC1_ANGAN
MDFNNQSEFGMSLFYDYMILIRGNDNSATAKHRG